MKTEIKTIKTKDFEMRYFRFGTAGKQPIVILPGLSIKSVTESADAVVNAYSLLSDDYDVYLLDRRQGPVPHQRFAPGKEPDPAIELCVRAAVQLPAQHRARVGAYRLEASVGIEPRHVRVVQVVVRLV